MRLVSTPEETKSSKEALRLDGYKRGLRAALGAGPEIGAHENPYDSFEYNAGCNRALRDKEQAIERLIDEAKGGDDDR